MIKHLIVCLLVLIGLSGLGSAATGYVFNGDGSPTYPNEGYLWIHDTSSSAANTIHYSNIYESGGADNYYIYVYMTTSVSQGGSTTVGFYQGGSGTSTSSVSCNEGSGGSCTQSTTYNVVNTLGNQAFRTWYNYGSIYNYGLLHISLTPFNIYSISGNTDCITDVTLYQMINTSYKQINYTVLSGEDSYYFETLDNMTYKLIFSDTHEYEFTVNGSNINYDHDDCSHTQYRFEESCENLIPDSEGLYIENYGLFGDEIKDFYAANGILDISNTSAEFMYVYTNTFIGKTGWIIDPVVDGTIYTLENPNIAWSLKVIVQNESDGSLIDGAMIKVDQTCYCTSGYSTRQKFTVSGMVEYGDMSLQDASLFVMASGYKILNENSTGYSTFLSGRSNFSSKTWIVKLAPSSSNNTSSFYEVSNKVDIHFRDVNGNRTSQILDTDAEVYLYYENNNTNEEAMTLKFQSSSTHTYFIDEQSWTIAYDDIGHKTIANSYFTPWDYSYRAVIYNSSIYGWNMTIPLTVRNGTRETEQHYQNLTTNLWFMYAPDAKVDYRDDMRVAIHARSNNTTLMNIDIELWDNGVYKDHVNLTETEFAGADFPYYYMWSPIYDYETGHNYTVLMYGFDQTLLETDYVECISDETTRKNKLTIGVKDSHGAQLTNAYIYLEEWGSLPTGSLYYNAYEGIDNGDFRYKATKSGYTGGGWDEVNLTDEDKIVWYILTEDYRNTSFTQTKFEDRDIKGIFFPLMYFLLICLLLGGLKYVAS